jgi:Spy/CpxP family protein refolding chaperone
MKNPTTRILTIAVVLLLLANIALVIFMVKGKRHSPPKRSGRGEPSEIMVKELGMTEQQQKDYKELKEEHFKNVRPLFDSVRAAKTAFFGLVKEANISDSLIDAYNKRVIDQQVKLDKLTFEHFRRVRNLFTAEQQPKFDSFIVKMMQRGKRDSSGKDKR